MGITRKTKSVALVLEAFEKDNTALSVVNLVELMDDNMNKTTVYRILDRLEDQGVVHSFYGKDGLKWYSKCSNCSSQKHVDHHPHLQCKDCGIVEPVPLEIPLPELPNVIIDSAKIMLIGTCSRCNQ